MTTDKFAKQLELLEAYRKEGKCTIIKLCVPEKLHTLPMHIMHIESVKIDPEKDIYMPKGAKGFCLSLSALERLGQAALVDWEWDQCRTTTHTPDLVCYKAVGFYRRENNAKVAMIGEGDKNIPLIRREYTAIFTAKARKDKLTGQAAADFISHNTEIKTMKIENKMVPLAKSEAMGQVLRKLLQLGQTYPKAMFDYPIVIVRCEMVPDLDDPEIKKAFTDAAVSSITGIYGPGSQPRTALPYAPVEEDDDYHGDDTEIELPEGHETTGEEPDENPEPEDQEEKSISAFRGFDADMQKTVLGSMVKKKAYKFLPDAHGKARTLTDIKAEQYVDFFKHLSSLDDAPPVDDIPF